MIDLEDDAKAVDTAPAIKYRVLYRRRGSDFIFSVTADNRIVVSRKNHRTKQYKHYLHTQAEVDNDKEAIKSLLKEGKYKLIEASPNVTSVEDPVSGGDAAEN